jgi:hypothetical protein
MNDDTIRVRAMPDLAKDPASALQKVATNLRVLADVFESCSPPNSELPSAVKKAQDHALACGHLREEAAKLEQLGLLLELPEH